MCGRQKLRRPLMAMRIVAIVVHKNPGRPAFTQHAMNFAQAACWIRPVVCRLDRNRSREETRIPRNLVHTADDEHGVLESNVVPSRSTNHSIGNIHANHAAFGHALESSRSSPPTTTPPEKTMAYR